MGLLPFDTLPAYRPRHFVPEVVDFGQWPHIAPLFDQLETRVSQCTGAADLERWLLDWSELNAVLDEEGGRRYIAMTCHTDDADVEKAYLHFIENIEPQTKPRQFRLEQLFIQHPAPQAADAALRGFQPRHAESRRVVSTRERPARNRGNQARAAISKTQRLAHGELPR